MVKRFTVEVPVTAAVAHSTALEYGADAATKPSMDLAQFHVSRRYESGLIEFKRRRSLRRLLLGFQIS
jgi:hypothetical protein